MLSIAKVYIYQFTSNKRTQKLPNWIQKNVYSEHIHRLLKKRIITFFNVSKMDTNIFLSSIY